MQRSDDEFADERELGRIRAAKGVPLESVYRAFAAIVEGYDSVPHEARIEPAGRSADD